MTDDTRRMPTPLRRRVGLSRARAAVALCVVGVLVIAGCSAPTSGSTRAGAPSPSATVASPPAAARDGLLAALTWADGAPIEATTISHDDATDVTLEPFVGDGRADLGGFQPAVVLADGEAVVFRSPTPEDEGAVPEIGRWAGAYSPLTSSKGLVPDTSGRQMIGADTDGTTLVWTEATVIQGSYYAPWRLFAAPLAGGKARLLARSEQLWDGKVIASGHRTVPRISGGRAWMQTIVPEAGAGRMAVVSSSLTASDLRVEARHATHPHPLRSDVVIVRNEGESSMLAMSPDGPETITSLEIMGPDGGTQPVMNVTQEPEGVSPLGSLGSTGDHLVISSAEELLVADPATRSAAVVPASPGRPISNLWVCRDLVAWTTADPADPVATTEAYLLVPSSGRLLRRETPDVTVGVMCGEGTVVWADRPAGETEGWISTITRAP